MFLIETARFSPAGSPCGDRVSNGFYFARPLSFIVSFPRAYEEQGSFALFVSFFPNFSGGPALLMSFCWRAINEATPDAMQPLLLSGRGTRRGSGL